MSKKQFVVVSMLLTALGGAPVTRVSATAPPRFNTTENSRRDMYVGMPLQFEANVGQTASDVQYLARTLDSTIFLTPHEAVFVIGASDHNPPSKDARTDRRPAHVPSSVVRMHFVGGKSNPRPAAEERLPGAANYFVGRDPAQWHLNVPTYKRVRYADAYPGIDVVFYGNQQRLEYDFVISPGSDPTNIVLGFEGADGLEVDARGDLVLHTPHATVRQAKPRIYQDIDGRRKEISGRYVIRDRHRVGIQIGSYDPSHRLTVDPVLTYSTYLGGSNHDEAFAIAVDNTGAAYLTGQTLSEDFPGGNTPVSGSGFEAFVAKLNPTGTALVYTAVFGGDGEELGRTIALDSAGNAYVAGYTDSTDFPAINAAQASFGGSLDAFVAKIDATGSALLYSTYLGSFGFDTAEGIACDATGNCLVTGQASDGFPTVNASQTVVAGGADAYLTRLPPSGAPMSYSRLLGGSGYDFGTAVAVDGADNAYVTGVTESNDFPTVAALQPAYGGGPADVFVTKINAAGTGLIYSTYLGGTGNEHGEGVAVDAAGSAYVTGATTSTNFPTAGPIQATLAGGTDAFVSKLSASGSALVYSTYLGGSDGDGSLDIRVDTLGRAHIVGSTESPGFPTTAGAFQGSKANSTDWFIAKLNAAGSALSYSTFLGGSNGGEYAIGIALDSAMNPAAYVTGYTASIDWPTTTGVLQPTYGGNYAAPDAVVAKITDNGPDTVTGANVSVSAHGGTGVQGGASLTFSNVTAPGDTTFGFTAVGPAPPTGFETGQPSIYSALSTTASFSGPITVCMNYSGIAFTAPAPKLFHFEGGQWVDVTVSVNTVNSVVCGSVMSLSPFAMFQPKGVATIQPPITSNGSSVFNAKRGIVPVKFALSYSGVATCALPPASISLFRITNQAEAVNQGDFIGPSDSGTNFRVTNCQYIYNLATNTLGAGLYSVRISFNNEVVGSATFGLK